MRLPLASIRKGILAPTLAVAMSLVLVLGQVFNCCRLNASVSGSLENLLGSLVVFLESEQDLPGHGPAVLPGDAEPGSPHPGCHGHATLEDSRMLAAGYGDGPWVDADRSCLSESKLSSQFDQPPAPESALSVPLFQHPAPHAAAPRPVFPAPSVPEIDGDPPLYLRTQRLLV